jgi:hypothetical protein
MTFHTQSARQKDDVRKVVSMESTAHFTNAPHCSHAEFTNSLLLGGCVLRLFINGVDERGLGSGCCTRHSD